jgi:hypothetical protein
MISTDLFNVCDQELGKNNNGDAAHTSLNSKGCHAGSTSLPRFSPKGARLIKPHRPLSSGLLLDFGQLQPLYLQQVAAVHEKAGHSRWF